jgi:hypothetical protein
LRFWNSGDGAVEGRFRVTADQGAGLVAAIEARTNGVFAQARRDGQRESRDAYQADALVLLARDAETSSAERAGPAAVVSVRVDHTVLVRGHSVAGEVCEIDGVGPVSAATARQWAEDAIIRALLVDGDQVIDARTVGRSVPAKLRAALIERDRTCCVPGCGVAKGLEIHHWGVAYADGGNASMDNCCRVCHHHHALITYQHWTLTGGHHNWTWHPPPNTTATTAA